MNDNLLFPILLLALPLSFILLFLAVDTRECLKREQQMVRHPGWFQYLPVNNTTIMIWHPPREAMEDVCVEYKKDKS